MKIGKSMLESNARAGRDDERGYYGGYSEDLSNVQF
jgi:hypothetical protein